METKIVSDFTELSDHLKNDLRIGNRIEGEFRSVGSEKVTADLCSYPDLNFPSEGDGQRFSDQAISQESWSNCGEGFDVDGQRYIEVGYEPPVDENEEMCENDLSSPQSPSAHHCEENADHDIVETNKKDRRAKMTYARIEKKFRTQKALAEMVLASKKLIVQQKKIRIRGKLDESKTIDTNHSDRDLKTNGNEYELGAYIKNRGFEVASLYQQLGCDAKTDDVNMWGSRRDVVIEARERKSEWKTTKVTAWLDSLVEPLKKWNGQELPYITLLPYLPPKVQTYLDFGSGSGSGAVQVCRYLGSTAVTHCYDIENNLIDRHKGMVQFVPEVTREYDLVTMVNVIHHVADLEPVLAKAMMSVRVNGTLVIKDHFVNAQSILLTTLVHEMYEPTEFGTVSENLYFRNLLTIVEFIKAQGWLVRVEKLENNDVSNFILVCVNSRDGGLTRVAALEERMDLLIDEVLKLKEQKSNDYHDPSEKLRRGGAARRKNVIDRHDLAMANPNKQEAVERYPSGQQVKTMTVQDRQRKVKDPKVVKNPRDYKGPEVTSSSQDVGVGPKIVSRTREKKMQQVQYREKVSTLPSKPASKPQMQYVLAKQKDPGKVEQRADGYVDDHLGGGVVDGAGMSLAQIRQRNAQRKLDQ